MTIRVTRVMNKQVAEDGTVLYFGCLEEPGHFCHLPGTEVRFLYAKDEIQGFPWSLGSMDTGLLSNRQVPRVVDGRVHWVCAGNRLEPWFAFFWWDNSVDNRLNSNSGFYVKGFGPVTDAHKNVQSAFEHACKVWPQVVARQRKPLHLVHMQNSSRLSLLERGDIVVAAKFLDPVGAHVEPGTKGVVFELANAYHDNGGPMVRWFDGTACNIYEGDIE